MSADGQSQLDELIRNASSGIFKDKEKQFIQYLIGLKYSDLSSDEQIFIRRLYGWLQPKLSNSGET